MISLEGISSGRYRIFTQSGAEYEIDLDDRTVTRSPDFFFEQPQLVSTTPSTAVLLNVEHCQVGACALFRIALHIPDGLFTSCQTTPVQSIEQLDPRPNEEATTPAIHDLPTGHDDTAEHTTN